MRYTRKKVKNVRAYQIGSNEPYPHWLRKAIACNQLTIERNVGGFVDVCSFYWNGKKQYFYEGDWIVKTPEGPILPVSQKTFTNLYEKQLTKEEQDKLILADFDQMMIKAYTSPLTDSLEMTW